MTMFRTLRLNLGILPTSCKAHLELEGGPADQIPQLADGPKQPGSCVLVPCRASSRLGRGPSRQQQSLTTSSSSRRRNRRRRRRRQAEAAALCKV